MVAAQAQTAAVVVPPAVACGRDAAQGRPVGLLGGRRRRPLLPPAECDPDARDW